MCFALGLVVNQQDKLLIMIFLHRCLHDFSIFTIWQCWTETVQFMPLFYNLICLLHYLCWVGSFSQLYFQSISWIWLFNSILKFSWCLRFCTFSRFSPSISEMRCVMRSVIMPEEFSSIYMQPTVHEFSLLRLPINVNKVPCQTSESQKLCGPEKNRMDIEILH